MKDVSLSVRTAYIAKLKGFVKYNGVSVEIYGKRVPDNAKLPYIYFPNQNSSNDSSKTCFCTNHTVNVEVVWRSDTGMEQNILEDLSNQIMTLIATMKVEDNPQPVGFINVGTSFDSSNELIDYDGTFTYLRKILIFNNIIYEGDTSS